MMKRSEDNRNGLDIWEEDAPGSVRLAELAFNAIWAIAKPVPARILSGKNDPYTARMSLNPAMAAAGLASESVLRRPNQSPATRH